MTTKEGKALLRDCMEVCGCEEDLNAIIIYKYGNREHANMYQDDEIVTTLNRNDYIPGARYVVKCFCHIDVYAAWEVEAGHIQDTYICYKRDVEEMENEILLNWHDAPLDDNHRVHLFKGRAGVMEFVQRKLI